MYSRPYIAGWLGASERSCALATGERKSRPYAHTDSDSDCNPYTYAQADSYSNTQTDTHPNSGSGLLRNLERESGLHRRDDSEFERR